MEITILEDPACSWCWAFQPVVTAILFELAGTLKNSIRIRNVMGGLCDRPAVEASFFARHWQTAAELSGMPFNVAIWDRHVLRTTFEACRAVKAALSQGPAASHRILRRIREAYHVESVPIDDRETLIELARGEGLDADALREDLSNGRAEFLFDRDRREAAEYRFGFPTLLIRKHPNDPPTTLNGVVTYAEVLETLEIIGQSPRDRRRFTGRPDDWDLLFSIHPRLTLAEIRQVSRLDAGALAESCARNGVHEEGAFFVRETKPAMSH